MKVYFTLEYIRSRGVWVIFKNVEREHSMNFMGLHSGSKKECLEWAKVCNIKIVKN